MASRSSMASSDIGPSRLLPHRKNSWNLQKVMLKGKKASEQNRWSPAKVSNHGLQGQLGLEEPWSAGLFATNLWVYHRGPMENPKSCGTAQQGERCVQYQPPAQVQVAKSETAHPVR